ncbi:dihydroorotate dehydrogenase electron transfer subunit [Candidatus Sumerlaeota bacterium]|nr:dihydroorotate dehydrogenase electron transfer subunit [Candidatus Sumerlaeota bacterium]
MHQRNFCLAAPLTRVIRHNEVTAEHWYLAPAIANTAQAGQFLHIRVTQTTVPLLRRPISILGADPSSGIVRILFKAVGEGTKLLLSKREGDLVDIAGPLGTPFTLLPDRAPIMIAGGYGISPVLFLARNSSAHTTLIYGARTQSDILLLEENEQVFGQCIFTTNDGTLGETGMVDAPLRRLISQDSERYAIYACGPTPMLRVIAKIAEDNKVPCFVSMESHMACGVGVCGGCIVRTKDGALRTVCKDGPVFDAKIIDFESTK